MMHLCQVKTEVNEISFEQNYDFVLAELFDDPINTEMVVIKTERFEDDGFAEPFTDLYLEEEETPVTPPKQRQAAMKFSCHDCDRKFCNAKHLRTHRMTEHSISLEANEPLCEICGQVLKSGFLNYHLHRVHFKTLRQECDICGKGTWGKFEMAKHLRSHIPKTIQIKKRAKRKSIESLGNHLPKCEHCDKDFPDTACLKHHIQTSHTKLIQRQTVIDFFLQNPTWSASLISKATRAPKSTVLRTIRRFRDLGSIDRIPGTGRKFGTGDVVREKNIVSDLQLDPTLSIRELGRKHRTSPSNVSKILRKYNVKSQYSNKKNASKIKMKPPRSD